MSDFLSDLKAIKGQMIKHSAPANPPKSPKKNPNQDEFKDIFKDDESELADTPESKEHKFERLKDEFAAFVEYNKVKKI